MIRSYCLRDSLKIFSYKLHLAKKQQKKKKGKENLQTTPKQCKLREKLRPRYMVSGATECE